MPWLYTQKGLTRWESLQYSFAYFRIKLFCLLLISSRQFIHLSHIFCGVPPPSSLSFPCTLLVAIERATRTSLVYTFCPTPQLWPPFMLDGIIHQVLQFNGSTSLSLVKTKLFLRVNRSQWVQNWTILICTWYFIHHDLDESIQVYIFSMWWTLSELLDISWELQPWNEVVKCTKEPHGKHVDHALIGSDLGTAVTLWPYYAEQDIPSV